GASREVGEAPEGGGGGGVRRRAGGGVEEEGEAGAEDALCASGDAVLVLAAGDQGGGGAGVVGGDARAVQGEGFGMGVLGGQQPQGARRQGEEAQTRAGVSVAGGPGAGRALAWPHCGGKAADARGGQRGGLPVAEEQQLRGGSQRQAAFEAPRQEGLHRQR